MLNLYALILSCLFFCPPLDAKDNPEYDDGYGDLDDDDDDDRAQESDIDKQIKPEAKVRISDFAQLDTPIFEALNRNNTRFLANEKELRAQIQKTNGTLVFIEGYWLDYEDPVKVSARMMELVHAAGDGATYIIQTVSGKNNIAGLLDQALRELKIRQANVIAMISKYEFDELAKGDIRPDDWHNKRQVFVQSSQPVAVADADPRSDMRNYLTSQLLYEAVDSPEKRKIMVGIFEGPASSAHRMMRYFAYAKFQGMQADPSQINAPDIRLYVGADPQFYGQDNRGHGASQLASIRDQMLAHCGEIANFSIIDVESGKPMAEDAIAKRLKKMANGIAITDISLEGTENLQAKNLNPARFRIERSIQKGSDAHITLTYFHPKGSQGDIEEILLNGKSLTERLQTERLVATKGPGKTIFEFDYRRGFEMGEMQIKYLDRRARTRSVSVPNPFKYPDPAHDFLTGLLTEKAFYQHLIRCFEDAFVTSYAASMFQAPDGAIEQLGENPIPTVEDLDKRLFFTDPIGSAEFNDKYEKFRQVATAYQKLLANQQIVEAKLDKRIGRFERPCGEIF